METTIEVGDPSRVAEVRRAVAVIGHSHGLSEDFVGQASLVTTELCTNILKYASRGTITLSTHEPGGAPSGLDIVALDKGPGIANVEASSRDGHSTGGSLGLGLGTIRRAASLFDTYSMPAVGTGVFVRLTEKKATAPSAAFDVGARLVPMRNERVSGDGWAQVPVGPSLAISVVDGLGHGPKAAAAAQAALAAFKGCIASVGPSQAIRLAHQALLSTRGAVMIAIVIDPKTGTLRFSGIGNVAAVIHTGDAVARLPSSDGTVGYGMRTPRESTHAWEKRSILIINSDGLSSRWNLSGHPGLLSRHPLLIASVLHRDFSRNTDDATVVVVRQAA
ncbi:MAG TPA: SpoIIE family protein phosphatase [Caldimonas sp.]|jgi:anti-sigma regulatory factor (Ser/Thr protein kinase)|nr:SpoIIE family protein phosphatase [Caldimonas sp.]HEX2542900.1 SpoIIE family protein phosphatase [Caldimonas sp.]